MTVQELQSSSDLAPSWTEACPVEHGMRETRESRGPAVSRVAGAPFGAVPAGARHRPPNRESVRSGTNVVGSAGTRPVALREAASLRSNSLVSVAPGRRVLIRQTNDVRACRVEATAPARVVDDVPTWALLACGVLFAVVMLLALAFMGGPAYA